jgi:hypothetical protein
MPLPVSLRDFVNEMETFGDGCQVYLHRRTAEFFGTTEEMTSAAERDEDDDAPAWEAELLPKVREVMSSDDWLPLPAGGPVRDHSAFLHSYGPEDEGLYDDGARWRSVE